MRYFLRSVVFTRRAVASALTAAVLVCSCQAAPVSEFLETWDAGERHIRVGIQVSGLLGVNLQLRNAGETITINSNGLYFFSQLFRTGESYKIDIVHFPEDKVQFCSLHGNSGIIGESDAVGSVVCTYGGAAGPMVGGTIIAPLALSGNADTALNQWYAGDRLMPGSTDATGNLARFSSPVGLTTDGQYLYVQETGGARNARRINILSREVTTLGVSGGTDGIATDGEYLYTPNFLNCRIYKMNLATNVTTVLTGSVGCGTKVDGSAAVARFNQPIGISYSAGYLYITDYGNNQIRRVDAVTGATITVAGTGATGSNNGPGATATFNAPHGIFCYENRLYIGEFGNYTIRVIDLTDPNYTISVFAGNGGAGNTDGPALVAQFGRPAFFTTDGTFLYISDLNNFSIRRIHLATGEVTTISGSSLRQDSAIGTGGLAGTAGFERPKGLASDGRYLYLADSTDHIIRRIE